MDFSNQMECTTTKLGAKFFPSVITSSDFVSGTVFAAVYYLSGLASKVHVLNTRCMVVIAWLHRGRV